MKIPPLVNLNSESSPKSYKVQECHKSTTQLASFGCLLKDLEREESCCLLKSSGLSVWRKVKGLLSCWGH